MATITATADGNWSAGGTWTGGVVPGNGDTADTNGHTVTQNITTIPASGTLLAIQNTGGGTINCPDGSIINATTVLNKADNAQVLTPAGALTINGNVSNTANAAVSSDTTLVLITAGQTTINGNVSNSGNNTSGDPIYGNTTCAAIGHTVPDTLAITGNVTNSGSTAFAIESTVQSGKGLIVIGGNLTNSGTSGSAIRFAQGSEACTVQVAGDAGNTGTNGYVLYTDSTYHGAMVDVAGNWSNSTGTNGGPNTTLGNLTIIRGDCSANMAPIGYTIVLGQVTGSVTLSNQGVLFSYPSKTTGTFSNSYGLWCCWGDPNQSPSWVTARATGGSPFTISLPLGINVLDVDGTSNQLSIPFSSGAMLFF